MLLDIEDLGSQGSRLIVSSKHVSPTNRFSILAFANRIRRPSVTTLDSKTLKDFVVKDDIVVVAQLSSKDDSLRELLSDAAQEYHDRYTFGASDTDSANRGISCYNNVEGTQHAANDLASVRVIHNLVEACIEPTIPELTRRNEAKYLSVRSRF